MKQTVTEIWAVGHSIDGAKEDGNQWCFYWQSQSSVCIDITPSYMEPSTATEGGSKANMVISSLDYRASRASQSIVKMRYRDYLLVEEVVNTLIEAGV